MKHDDNSKCDDDDDRTGEVIKQMCRILQYCDRTACLIFLV